MKACSELKETLFLDIYGELSPGEREIWESHLSRCPGCREERERLFSLLERVREEVQAPELSSEAAQWLQKRVTERLRSRGARAGWAKRLFGIPISPLPAAIVASLLLLVLGWIGLRAVLGPAAPDSMADLAAEEKIIVEDMKVLEDLDLLEEMDVIQKLVRVVDHRDTI